MDNTIELQNYEQYLKERELAQRTREIYLAQAKKFMMYLQGRSVTKSETIAYKEWLMGQGKKMSTMNLELTAMNRYLKYAEHADCIVKVRKLQRKTVADNMMTAADYRKLLVWARKSGREKYYCIMRTLALTGIRISELSDCTVEAVQRGKFSVYNKGKCREVYLPEKLTADLRTYCGKYAITEGVIFTGIGKKPVSRNAVYRMLARLADDLGIPQGRVHPHSFRHLFAVTYMQQYSDLSELADLLGHSSLETTRIYTVVTGEERRKKMNQLEL